jgi:hypothetical protein
MPSDVIVALDRMLPHAAHSPANAKLDHSHSGKLRSLLELVKDIPGELIDLSPQDYATFVQVKTTISDALDTWASRGATGNMPNVGDVDAASALRRLLVKLGDEFPAPKFLDLAFITDPELREDVSLDVGVAERSLFASEWKLAMMMAGAVIEDLLHWKLGQLDPSALRSAKKAPKEALDNWKLYSMIDVAEELSVLKSANTITSARVAKDYRNLIHPGRRARRAERPTRAKAYIAIGGMYGVIDELR